MQAVAKLRFGGGRRERVCKLMAGKLAIHKGGWRHAQPLPSP